MITRRLTVINANARSLAPKIESLADCMEELQASISIVTETWLQDRNADGTIIDVAGEHGLSANLRNRQATADNGRQYGGVAIFSRSSTTNFKPLDIANPDDFEVLCVSGKVSKIKEKVVVVAVYIPPGYTRPRAESCVEYISDVVAEAKRRIDSPLIIVGGDWNQWKLQPILDDHPELGEVDHGPTRLDRKIDRFLVNFPRAIEESDVASPLDDGLGRVSDHRVAFFRAGFSLEPTKTVKYKYRHFTEQGAARFQSCWLCRILPGSMKVRMLTNSLQFSFRP